MWLAAIIKDLNRLVAHFSQTFIPAKSLISIITNNHRSKTHTRVTTQYVKLSEKCLRACVLACIFNMFV